MKWNKIPDIFYIFTKFKIQINVKIKVHPFKYCCEYNPTNAIHNFTIDQ